MRWYKHAIYTKVRVPFLANLTGLHGSDYLLSPSRPHCVEHHWYDRKFKSSTLRRHPLSHLNPSLKWGHFQKLLLTCIEDGQFLSCSWTLSTNYFSNPPSLISKGHASPFTASTRNHHLHCTGWRGACILLSFSSVVSQFGSSKNSAFNINIYQFVFKRTVNPSLPHSTGWYFYNVYINMWFQWDDFTLLFLLC